MAARTSRDAAAVDAVGNLVCIAALLHAALQVFREVGKPRRPNVNPAQAERIRRRMMPRSLPRCWAMQDLVKPCACSSQARAC
ncbi:MAG: hypothetical protein ACRYFS_13475 [Janthinobacterium lividum]